MHASNLFPFDLRWDSHDLADAVPQRLSQRLRFDPADAQPCADRARPPHGARTGYLPSAQPAALFRVRG